jgi:hypothetical protein
MKEDSLITARFKLFKGVLDERQRRLCASIEAKVLGRGGVKRVHEATGVSRGSILAGIKELESGIISGAPTVDGRRMRRAGAGRKKLVDSFPGIRESLERMVDPVTRGDPESPLRWTCKSLTQLATALNAEGYAISHVSVGKLLKELGYRLQGNRKSLEGSAHPDRNAQFEYIHSKVETALGQGQPVISVDTKKKELVGQFKNGGKEWQPQGKAEGVNVYDFVDAKLGRANPYGVYDIGANSAWVSVGTDHDTASFAVATIRRWWLTMGKAVYPAARELMITADGGGSNGSRVRLWKRELQQLSNEIAIPIRVSHFPPGTSKWNKIEHRLFSHISLNWRGKPLVTHDVIVNLISATTTRKGLKVQAGLDTTLYPKGIKVSNDELAAIRLARDEFHGEWNYVISPNTT